MFARSVCRPTRRLLHARSLSTKLPRHARSLSTKLPGHARSLSTKLPDDLSTLLATDPAAVRAVIAALPRDSRREVGLAWAVSELEDEFARADVDADGQLTYAEFKEWGQALVRSDGPSHSDAPPTRSQLMAVFGRTAVPYLGFGAVDNALMVLTGEAIDSTFGVVLGLSTLAAAALGNAFSNGCGMFLHGTIERFAGALGLPDPRLTIHQRGYRSVKNVKMAAGIIGVVFGCILGMSPLLVMSAGESKEEKKMIKKASERASA